MTDKKLQSKAVKYVETIVKTAKKLAELEDSYAEQINPKAVRQPPPGQFIGETAVPNSISETGGQK